nr:hypothetical protein CFP56_60101 [Quercus suber]
MICSFQTGNELFLNGLNESGLLGTSTRCCYGNCTSTKYVSFDYKLCLVKSLRLTTVPALTKLWFSSSCFVSA